MATSTKVPLSPAKAKAVESSGDSSDLEEDHVGLAEAFRPKFEIYSTEIMRVGPLAKKSCLLGNVDAAHGDEE